MNRRGIMKKKKSLFIFFIIVLSSFIWSLNAMEDNKIQKKKQNSFFTRSRDIWSRDVMQSKIEAEESQRISKAIKRIVRKERQERRKQYIALKKKIVDQRQWFKSEEYISLKNNCLKDKKEKDLILIVEKLDEYIDNLQDFYNLFPERAQRTRSIEKKDNSYAKHKELKEQINKIIEVKKEYLKLLSKGDSDVEEFLDTLNSYTINLMLANVRQDGFGAYCQSTMLNKTDTATELNLDGQEAKQPDELKNSEYKSGTASSENTTTEEKKESQTDSTDSDDSRDSDSVSTDSSEKDSSDSPDSDEQKDATIENLDQLLDNLNNFYSDEVEDSKHESKFSLKELQEIIADEHKERGGNSDSRESISDSVKNELEKDWTEKLQAEGVDCCLYNECGKVYASNYPSAIKIHAAFKFNELGDLEEIDSQEEKNRFYSNNFFLIFKTYWFLEQLQAEQKEIIFIDNEEEQKQTVPSSPNQLNTEAQISTQSTQQSSIQHSSVQQPSTQQQPVVQQPPLQQQSVVVAQAKQPQKASRQLALVRQRTINKSKLKPQRFIFDLYTKLQNFLWNTSKIPFVQPIKKQVQPRIQQPVKALPPTVPVQSRNQSVVYDYYDYVLNQIQNDNSSSTDGEPYSLFIDEEFNLFYKEGDQPLPFSALPPSVSSKSYKTPIIISGVCMVIGAIMYYIKHKKQVPPVEQEQKDDDIEDDEENEEIIENIQQEEQEL